MGNKVAGAEKNKIIKLNQPESPFENEYLSTYLPTKTNSKAARKTFINDFKYYKNYNTFVTISQISRRAPNIKRDKVTVMVTFWTHINNEFRISKSFKIIHPFTDYTPFSLNSSLKSVEYPYLFLDMKPWQLYGQTVFAFDLLNESQTEPIKPLCKINLGRAQYDVFRWKTQDYLIKYNARNAGFRSATIYKFPSTENIFEHKGQPKPQRRRKRNANSPSYWCKQQCIQLNNAKNIIYCLDGCGKKLYLDKINLETIKYEELNVFDLGQYDFIKWDRSDDYAKTFDSETIKAMKISPNGHFIMVVPNDGFFILSIKTGDILWRVADLFHLKHSGQPLYGGWESYVSWYKSDQCIVYVNHCFYQFVVIDTQIVMKIFEDIGFPPDIISILLQFCIIENVINRFHKIDFEENANKNERNLRVGDLQSFVMDDEIKIVSRRKVHYYDYKKVSNQTLARFQLETYTLKSNQL